MISVLPPDSSINQLIFSALQPIWNYCYFITVNPKQQLTYLILKCTIIDCKCACAVRPTAAADVSLVCFHHLQD